MPAIIQHGDAFERIDQVPNGSVDLILTDPIYTRLEDYLWLEQVAVKKLKPEGNILAFQSGFHLAKTLKALQTVLPVLSAVQQTNGNLSGLTIAKSYHLVWMGSGKTARNENGRRRFVVDGYVSNTWSKVNSHVFKWEKNPLYIRTVMNAFVNPRDTVLDPFCGSGTVPAVAQCLGMDTLGFEQDEAQVALAQARCSEAGRLELAKMFEKADALARAR